MRFTLYSESVKGRGFGSQYLLTAFALGELYPPRPLVQRVLCSNTTASGRVLAFSSHPRLCPSPSSSIIFYCILWSACLFRVILSSSPPTLSHSPPNWTKKRDTCRQNPYTGIGLLGLGHHRIQSHSPGICLFMQGCICTRKAAEPDSPARVGLRGSQH